MVKEEMKDAIINLETVQLCLDHKLHDLQERSERNKRKIEELKNEFSRIYPKSS
jgi:hypothetical protein